jgi:hypothetical protein
MNESLYLELARLANQAAFLTGNRFAGLLYNYEENHFEIHLQGKENLRVPLEILTRQNLLELLVNGYRKLKEIGLGRSNIVA